MRTAVLTAALAFTIAFGVLTLRVLVNDGIDILVVFSLLVLALFGVGIVGALRHPPDE